MRRRCGGARGREDVRRRMAHVQSTFDDAMAKN
jgi:hypothetical protein